MSKKRDFCLSQNGGKTNLQAGVGKPTFTRATVATVTDFEGLIKNVKSGEARFEGARRVENLLTYSEDFSNVAWVTSTSGTGVTAIKTPNYALAPDGSLTATRLQLDIGSGTTASDRAILYHDVVGNLVNRISVWLKTTDGSTKSISLSQYSNSPVATVDGTWKRFSDYPYARGGERFQLGLFGDRPSSKSADILIWHPQHENNTGQANQNPSEYVSTNVKTSAPYHGANVDGVKYFTTLNGNTVASNVVTEAVGANIPSATLHGYLAEGVRTNLALQSETLGTTWTPTTLTVANNSTVAPSGATTAETLTATAGNATLLQAITGTAASYTFSVYLKRLTGTGAVSISADGTTFTTCTVSSTVWTRCTDTRTLTVASYNQTIQIATNGDAIYAWGAQAEQASFASSYIPTTSASVTRNGDILSYPTSGNFTVLNPYTVTLESAIESGSPTGAAQQVAIGSTQNYAPYLMISNGSASPNSYFYSGTTNVSSITNSDANKLLSNKYAARMDGTNVNIFMNGTKGTTNTKGTQTSEIAVVTIGAKSDGSSYLFGTVKGVKIWKKALTDTQLQNLTSTNSAVSQSAVKKTTITETGTTTINASQNTKLTDGLVGLWSFNGPDVSDTAIYDRSGQGNNGYFIGGATSSAKTIGKVGQALQFDGVNDYVDAGDPVSGVLDPSLVTISAWIKRNALNGGAQYIVSKSRECCDTPGLGGYELVLNYGAGSDNGNRLSGRFWRNSNQTVFSLAAGSVVTAGQWHHVVMTYNGSTMKLYLDGVLDGTSNVTDAIQPTTKSLIIGALSYNKGYLFSGSLDEVRIYNRALSASEVSQLYNLGR